MTDTPAPARTLYDLPQPKGRFIGGIAASFADNALRLMRRSFSEFGELVHMPMGGQSYVLVSHPDAVHRILTENARNYDKAIVSYQALKPLLGEGLLTSSGEFWLRQRRIAAPAFHRERIEGFADDIVRCTLEMLDSWQPAIDAGDALDIHQEMTKLTLRIIGLTMLSVDLVNESSDLGDAATLCLNYADTMVSAAGVAWDAADDEEFAAAKDLLDLAIANIIAERQAMLAQGEPAPHDLLTLLLQARDPETGEGMDAQQLRDETMTVFMAGHETTANAMTWIFRSLSGEQQVRDRFHAQLDACGEGPTTLAELPSLPYGKQIILESLRLYPTAWMIGRNSIDSDVLQGVEIPAQTKHFICLFVLHRHPDYWEEPDRFSPDRFEEGREGPHQRKGLFIPFGAGPRQCIGGAYAMMSTQLMLANICRRVELDLKPGFKPDFDAGITLRPDGGMPMIARPRAPSRP